MSDQKISALIEIPPDVAQQEVWDLESTLRRVEGVETDLQEPRDVLGVTMLVLHVATSIMEPVAVIGGGIKSVYDVAVILHKFLHPTDKEKSKEEGKKKMVIIKKGKRIELYGLSIKEIERILKER